MALSKSGLKDRIISGLAGQGFDTDANGRDNGGWLPKFAEAVADAVIDEIQANARAVGDGHNLPIE